MQNWHEVKLAGVALLTVACLRGILPGLSLALVQLQRASCGVCIVLCVSVVFSFLKALSYVCNGQYAAPNFTGKQPILIEQDCTANTGAVF